MRRGLNDQGEQQSYVTSLSLCVGVCVELLQVIFRHFTHIEPSVLEFRIMHGVVPTDWFHQLLTFHLFWVFVVYVHRYQGILVYLV